ncbi:MAG: hypothetical protein SGARI_005580, partial [Bacillariaceae sp.]
MALLHRHSMNTLLRHSTHRLTATCRYSLQWLSSVASSSSAPQILLEQNNENFISQLTLNRPKANAMGKQFMHELSECLTTFESNKNSTRCLILTSHSNRVFSAGADLKERATMSQEEAADFVCLLRNTMERVAQLPMPVIAAVEGVAVGG